MKSKKAVKIMLRILGLLLLLIVLGILFGLGSTVKLAAEKIGSKALGTPIQIEKLSILPLKGTVHLSGFFIANHDEFNRSNTVSLASMDLAIDMGSLFSDTVTVHRIAINSPHFIYERNAASDNISAYLENIQHFTGIEPAASPEDTNRERGQATSAKTVIVESLEINDIQFHLANTDDPQLDVDIGLEQLTVSMTNGNIRLENFHISNPGRLTTANLFQLDGMYVSIDPKTFHSDTVSILDAQVIRPYAYLELNTESDTIAEFTKIAAALAARASSHQNSDAEDVIIQRSTPSTSPLAPPIQLHNLLMDDLQIHLLDTIQTNAPQKLAGIATVSVKLVDGGMQIKDITVPNPDGFTATNLFQLTTIDISIEPDSVFSDQVVIKEILVHSPEINLEQTKTSGNVTELQAMLSRFALPVPAEKPKADKKATPVPLAEQPIVLHALLVTNFTVNLTLPLSTNTLETGLANLATLNPLGGVSLKDLNPLTGFGGSEITAQETDASTEYPLKLLSFEQLSVEPLKGLLQIDGLQLANPPGFANRYLIDLSKFALELDPNTLQSDTLFIRDILIDQPKFTYERKITTDNIKILLEGIEKAAAGKAIEERSPAESPEPLEKTGQNVIIKHLLAQNGSVKAKLSIIPSTPSIPLPDIEISDLGSGDEGAQGVNIADALSRVTDTFYDAIIGSVSSATGFAGDALKGVGALIPFGSSSPDDTHATVTAASAPTAETPVEENKMDAKAQERSFYQKHRRRILTRPF